MRRAVKDAATAWTTMGFSWAAKGSPGMKLNWLWFDLVDPDLPLDRSQRQGVKRRAKQLARGFRTGFNLPDLLTVFGGVAVAGIPIVIMMSGIYMPRSGRSLVVFLAFSFIAPYTVTILLNRWSRQRWTNLALRDLGYEVCVDCGYWLRGLDGSAQQCPECGATRQPLAALSAQDA